jgi:hypothetical protein
VLPRQETARRVKRIDPREASQAAARQAAAFWPLNTRPRALATVPSAARQGAAICGKKGDWPSSVLRTSLGQEGGIMRHVGHRQERPISFSASAALLAEGARFNDEIHRLPTGNATFIPKGIFRFKTHADANRHQLDCLVEGMAQAALARR